MIKAIFTDLDGVIRHWDNQNLYAIEANCRLPKGFLFQRAFAKPLLLPTVTGQQTHEEWNQQIEESLQADVDANVIQQLLSAREASPWSIDLLMLEAYRSVVPNAKLILVTNATDRLYDDLSKAGIEGRFDVIVNSSEIGFAKPDIGFYQAAITMAGVAPYEAIYIDDSRENVKAARSMGFRAVLFCDREQALSELRELADNQPT